ncbi:hypothetical protein TNCV_1103151 [Trichonephila clavipes]|nr:hypothetical protein TNCV_1103151 [Trichonephila clavipes]
MNQLIQYLMCPPRAAIQASIRTDSTLGEMGWFVVFSGVAAIPLNSRHSSTDRNENHPLTIPDAIRWSSYDDDDSTSGL